MHNNLYRTAEPKIELDFAKSLVVIVTLMLTFVIPVQVITYLKSQPAAATVATTNTTNLNTQSQATLQKTTATGTTTSGKVAGTSTTKAAVKGVESIYIPIINQTIDLNSQTGLLILLGTFLIGISVLLTLYLVIDGAREDQHKKHYR